MRISNHYKSISRLLILLSFTSFFIGFFYGENSAGGGTLQGDFDNVWTSNCSQNGAQRVATRFELRILKHKLRFSDLKLGFHRLQAV